MWQPQTLQATGASVTSIAAAATAATLARTYTSPAAEVYSELISWVLLPIAFKTYGSNQRAIRTKAGDVPFQYGAESTTRGCWTVAGAAAIAAFLMAENRTIGLIPFVTPALFFVQARLDRTLPSAAAVRKSSDMQIIHMQQLLTLAVAVYNIFALSEWNLRGFIISGFQLAALVAIYSTLLPKRQDNRDGIPFVDIEKFAVPVAVRTCACLLFFLGLQTVVIGSVPFDLLSMIAVAVFKAVSLLFLVHTARETSWVVSTAIYVFALVSSRSPYLETFEGTAISNIFDSGVATAQIIWMTPTTMRFRNWLWALLLLSLIPYVSNRIAIENARSRAVAFSDAHTHPVQTLVDKANRDYEHLLNKQSKAYDAAVAEYRHRYQNEPPPGFQAWFEFAKKHDSPIIDDFDVLYDSIAPLWHYSGEEMLKIMDNAKQSPKNELWMCKYSTPSSLTECHHQFRLNDRHFSTLFNEATKHIPGHLPDMEILVNHFDEPRVMFPPHTDQANHFVTFEQRYIGLQQTWDILAYHCKEPWPRHSSTNQQSPLKLPLPFVQDVKEAMDVCRHREYQNMHGLFSSPTLLYLAYGMVPILSSGSPSTMNDIIFPSPAYLETEFLYSPQKDVEWSKKRANLYWAGSTSGGYFMKGYVVDWMQSHRQRFVAFAQGLLTKSYTYLADNQGSTEVVKSPFLNSRLFDVSFTRVYSCVGKPCREQTKFFRMSSWKDKDEALRSQLVFDLDGHGISGRWYKLLASKSAPLKQTMLREWHDDRLVPWVHYIPVSIEMEELPELVTFLTSTTKGQEIARKIGEQGQDWYNRALRKIDINIYTYRLMLELARLQDPGRKAL